MNRYVSDKYYLLSSEPFPTNVRDGADAFVYDTKKIYYKISGNWCEVAASGAATESLSGYSIIRNGITGSGTVNYIPIFTSSSGVINSEIQKITGFSGSIYYQLPVTRPFQTVHVPFQNDYDIRSDLVIPFLGLKILSSTGSATGNFEILPNPGALTGTQSLLYWRSGVGILRQKASNNRASLIADWIPNSGDMLSLMYNPMEARWVEQWRYPPYTGFLSGINGGTVIQNGITGEGTPTYIPVWSSPSGISNSTNYESGSNLCVQNVISTVSGLREIPGPNRYYNIDFNSSMYQTGYITGIISFRTLNRGMGKNVSVRLFASGANSLSFTNETWTWMGNNPPANMLDQKNLIISMNCFGTGYSDVFATWAAQA